MKFLRIGALNHERPTVMLDGVYYDISSITRDVDGNFLSSDRVSIVRKAAANQQLPIFHLDSEARIGAPIARPHNVICVGMNYAAHAAESSSTTPAVPIMFLKPSNTVVGPYDPVDIPKTSVRTDWEVELGVVIGKPALYLNSTADSAKHIAGYVTANDISERDFQLVVSGGQWSKGKSAPGFTPIGPWLVTPDEVNNKALRLQTFVNGALRQDSITSDMIFSVEFLIWHLSQYMLLEAGDLLLTGTPEGVALSGKFPYLSEGDICEIEIHGLGRQRQSFTQA